MNENGGELAMISAKILRREGVATFATSDSSSRTCVAFGFSWCRVIDAALKRAMTWASIAALRAASSRVLMGVAVVPEVGGSAGVRRWGLAFSGSTTLKNLQPCSRRWCLKLAMEPGGGRS